MSLREMKAFCILTVEVENIQPGRVGPKAFGNSMPEFSREIGKDYAPDETTYRRIPTAQDLSVAEHFTDLVNSNLSEADRKEIWLWGWLKWSNGHTIKGHCDKFGLKQHEYRRRIDIIFSNLAEKWKDFARVSDQVAVDGALESEDIPLKSEKYWRDDKKFKRRRFLQDLIRRSDQGPRA